MKLEEEGKLGVNDKVSKYIPDFPRGDEVTLRHLLTHTSGIHDYTDDQDILSRVTNATTTETLIDEMKKDPYDFDPGTKFRYDNAGYLLLGYIVEKVSGQSYGDFLREKFFQPLGMTNTGVYRALLGLPHEAMGYGLGTNGFKRALYWDPSWSGGAGALYSTVGDLYRWNEGIFNARALDAASLKAVFTPVKVTKGQVNSDTGYGFGWAVDRHRGLRVFHHGGSLPGFRSCLLRVPDEKFTVTTLANARPGRPGADAERLTDQLVEIFLADKLASLPIVNTNVSPKSYDALTGRYDLGIGGKGSAHDRQQTRPASFVQCNRPSGKGNFSRVHDRILLERGGRPNHVREGQQRQGCQTYRSRKRPRPGNPAGKVTKTIYHQGGQTVDAPKIQ